MNPIPADQGEDHAGERQIAAPVTMNRLYLRRDEEAPDLPLVVETETGHVVARFEHPGDLAIFVSRDRQTLPTAFLALLNKEEPQ